MRKCIVLGLLITLFVLPAGLRTQANNFAVEDYSLVIYTYESLLADPGYDYISGFANFSGIPEEEIQVILLDDANSVVTQAALEKNNPVADVLIGIDNVLIHTAKEEGILQSYDSPALVNISQDIIDNLDPEKYVLPYDMGVIALWYDLGRMNSTTNPELDSLTLEDILDYDLDKNLIVENPNFSSPGLGFLLWTIAVYGDEKIGFNGLLSQDWRKWWKEAKKDLRIASSWGDAFSIYYTEENRPIMVSYGTSPAYDVCHPDYGVGEGNPPPSAAVVSHENPTALPYIRENAWLQIEGIGLVKNAPHDVEAKKFIDWFLDTDLQDNIPLNNWMFPANVQANIPTCFTENSIGYNFELNTILTPEMIRDHLDKWLDDWEGEVASFGTIAMLFFSLLAGTIVHVIIRKRKK